MIMMIIPIIFMIILLILFVIFLMVFSKQEKTLKTVDKDGKIKDDKKNMELKQKSTNGNFNTDEDKKLAYKKEDVFKFMEFDRILDNMIVQNGGSRFTMAIRCKGINYDLMSEMEQLSVEEGFITFLNTLKYPIQLYVQAQNIDLKGNIAKYRSNIIPLTNDYNEVNEKYNKIASAFDADERELESITKERDKISNVYEYANDIIRYVEKMSTNKNLLQRKFFVLVSYNTSEINAVDKFDKDEIIEMCSTELMTRCKGIISALSSCSVSGEVLNSNELADLLYSAYNRDDKSLMSVKEAIEGGMLRLYSTSEDAFEKKEEQLDEYLKNQAQLRAYKAIKYAKEHDKVETPASQMLSQEEEISRRATAYVKNSDYSPEEKDIATAKILSDYREDKKSLTEIHEIQKKAILDEAEKDIEKIPQLEKEEPPYGIKLIEKSKNYKENEEKKDLSTDSENKISESIQNLDNKNEEKNEIKKVNDEKNQEKVQNSDLSEENIYVTDSTNSNEEDDSIV